MLILLFTCLSGAAGDDRDGAHLAPFELNSVRAMALGGHHAALVDDFSHAFNNPAGFGAIERKVSVAEISVTATSMEILSEIYFNDVTIDTVLGMIKDRVEASTVIGGPFNFGVIDNGFGWRVFNVSRANLYWDRDDIFLLNPTFSEEAVLNFGYGKRLVSTDHATFEAGILLKGFYRIAYIPEGVFIQEIKHVFSEMKYQPFESQIGGGFDAGLRWTWQDSFSIGLAYKDIYSPAYVTRYLNLEQFNQQVMYQEKVKTVDPRLSLGIVWRLPSPEMHRHNTDLIFAADYNILPGTGTEKRNPLLNFSAGLEFRFLEVVSLRAGFADFLPSGGVGFNFTFCQLDITYAGKELSGELYKRSTWILSVGLSFQH
jgi:hypothetical protein